MARKTFWVKDLLFIRPMMPSRPMGSAVLSRMTIHRAIEFIKKQQQPVYDDTILTQKTVTPGEGPAQDDLYDEALRVVLETNLACHDPAAEDETGIRQGRRQIDIMEQNGIVGPTAANPVTS